MSNSGESQSEQGGSVKVPHVDVRTAILAIFEACRIDPHGFVEMENEAHWRSIQQQDDRKDVHSDE